MYVHEPSIHPTIEKRAGFMDLQKVFDSTATGTFASLNKSLASVGCPHPTEVFKTGTPIENDRAIRSFTYISDGGSDQMKYKKILSACFKAHPLMFIILIACLMHAQQLIVSGSLKTVDRYCKRSARCWPSFFSAIAKLIHLWRDNANQFDQQWLDQFHVPAERKLVAKCIAGRWGSIITTLTDIINRGVWEVRTIMLQLLPDPDACDDDDDDDDAKSDVELMEVSGP
jgi:hypothetical protein